MAIELSSLEDSLNKLPNLIYKKQEEVVEAKRIMDMTKAQHERDIAVEMLKSERPNATEKKAEAIKLTYQRKLEVINAIADFEGLKGQLDQLKTRFDSDRKLASIEIELMKNKI